MYATHATGPFSARGSQRMPRKATGTSAASTTMATVRAVPHGAGHDASRTSLAQAYRCTSHVSVVSTTRAMTIRVALTPL